MTTPKTIKPGILVRVNGFCGCGGCKPWIDRIGTVRENVTEKYLTTVSLGLVLMYMLSSPAEQARLLAHWVVDFPDGKHSFFRTEQLDPLGGDDIQLVDEEILPVETTT